eukprot:Opistho-1_new@34876
MKKITCIIVEDEPPALRLLEDHIGKISFLQLEARFFDAMAALQYLEQHTIDLIFLDINMPVLSGMDMAAMLPAQQKLIFTTAYSEYALDSFEYQVVDYLLKPISFKRFMQAVNKLTVFMQQEDQAPAVNSSSEENDFLFVKSGKQMHKIEYDAICYLEALKEYIAIHTETGKILVYKRMKDVAEQLPLQFVRIHNSYIVNLRHIKNIESHLVMVKGESLPVSNGYRSLFQERIQAKLL